MSAGVPATFAALATRMLPSTFTIHCLVRSREGWMIQASSTTASAPRRCGTRSSVTTSAEAHSTFGIERPGNRRARPRTDSTLTSFSSDRSTLVPMLPVAPTTTTLMQVIYPTPRRVKRRKWDVVPSARSETGRTDASTDNGRAGQGRDGYGGRVPGGRARRARNGFDAAGLRAARGRGGGLLPGRPHRRRRRRRGRAGRRGRRAYGRDPRADP